MPLDAPANFNAAPLDEGRAFDRIPSARRSVQANVVMPTKPEPEALLHGRTPPLTRGERIVARISWPVLTIACAYIAHLLTTKALPEAAATAVDAARIVVGM